MYPTKDRYTSFFVIVVIAAMWLLLMGLAAHPAQAALPIEPPIQSPTAPSGTCQDGEQTTGAKYRICMPSDWNKTLIVYAHGYVPFNRPIAIPEDQMKLPGSMWTIDQFANFLEYAFATTSYRVNGLAARPAVEDLLDVVHIFTTTQGTPDLIYVLGVSEGGLITALAIEQHPEIFDGGLAMCGPYGDFISQTHYFGDFGVVFQHFFPALLPGSPMSISDSLITAWDNGYYTTTVEPVIKDPANALSVTQLLAVTQGPYDAATPATQNGSIKAVLGYVVMATNDAAQKLGGQPYGNQTRWYTGSLNDVALNQQLPRFTASATALAESQRYYQTSGDLRVPLVTLHTLSDPVVPAWHAPLYQQKIIAAGKYPFHDTTTVSRYGHCNFTPSEAQSALERLKALVSSPLLVGKQYTSTQVAGSLVTYTLKVINTTATSVTHVVVSDTLPIGLSAVQSLHDGSLQLGALRWNFASIAGNGGSATTGFRATLPCTAGVTIANQDYRVISSAQGLTSVPGSPVVFTVISPTLRAEIASQVVTGNGGMTVTLTARPHTNGTPIVAWTWDFGDGTAPAYDLQVEHPYPTAGTFIATLTLTDTCGFSQQIHQQIVHPALLYLPLVLR